MYKKNKPYVKEYFNRKLMNPINGVLISDGPNRRKRRWKYQKERFIGNTKTMHLQVLKTGRFLLIRQREWDKKMNEYKWINHKLEVPVIKKEIGNSFNTFDKYLLKPGLKVFAFEDKTKQILEIEGNKPTGNFIFFQALNLKNAECRVGKYENGLISNLCNLKLKK